MTERWVLTRDDERGVPPSVEIRSDNVGHYAADDVSAWRGDFSVRGEGGGPVGGSHGLGLVTARVPTATIKPLGVLVHADTEALFQAAFAAFLRALGPVTFGRGLLRCAHHRRDGLTVSGRARVAAYQTELLTRRRTADCGQRGATVALELELPDGVLFGPLATTTVVAGSGSSTVAVITNGGTAEDVWAEAVITAGTATRVTVVNESWAGASPRRSPVGFTVYASALAAAEDDGITLAPGGTGSLIGWTADSGARTLRDGAGVRRDGHLVRRDYHPHLLPLHPGANSIRVSAAGGGATVELRRRNPYS